MPRTSAEERAASFYRAGKVRAKPPTQLSPAARKIWRAIVASKPVDWFDYGSLGLLADHCQSRARLEAIWTRLHEVKAGSPESLSLAKEMRIHSARMSTTARQLRLTVQHAITRQASMAGESTDPAVLARRAASHLLGGYAVRN
jgi:hypothetical protein